MAKAHQNDSDKTEKPGKSKEKGEKKELIGRVRKVIKKSRRKLSEEKFEKELQRTISFLEEMQEKLNKSAVTKASDEVVAKPNPQGSKPKAKKAAARKKKATPAAGGKQKAG
ncbi:MAG: hypothetical protein IPO77_03030 [Acidobacteria bacterium]|nr:hypothetical protein [Acidobacteriota bacterium]